MRSKQANREMIFWIKIGCAIFVAMFLTVWEHVEANVLARKTVLLHNEVDRITYENGKLQNQIFQWMSPTHLEALARQKFGMIPLESKHVIGIQKP
ncbi:MAG: hypothetical protein WC859_05340 [Elusimicrobiota bacterium]|jgi:hypothetical protein